MGANGSNGKNFDVGQGQVRGVEGFSYALPAVRESPTSSLAVRERLVLRVGVLKLPREQWFERFGVVAPNSNRMLLIWGKMIRESMKDLTKTRSLRKRKDPRNDKEEVAKAFEQATSLLMEEMREAIKITLEDVLKEKKRVLQGCTLKEFMVIKPKEYDGQVDPILSHMWVVDMESNFEMTKCKLEDRVMFSVPLLTGRAKEWLLNLRKERDELAEAFFDCAKFCPDVVSTEKAKIDRFYAMLMVEFRDSISPSSFTTLVDLINRCREREVELRRQEARGEKRKREIVEQVVKKIKCGSPIKKPFGKFSPRGYKVCGNEHFGECHTPTGRRNTSEYDPNCDQIAHSTWNY
ncbi:hypothetical protein L1987_76966 [Smallanthus sonchifolius]|uniref:Uncharacterized protein n=1 Tax=Smallanthus sonchifolius TaxID=185202 RepID=A0ACB8Z9I6_9ASTR|nr:hypothetical protein L1987_76966 [Smallanthus sonchifolius]